MGGLRGRVAIKERQDRQDGRTSTANTAGHHHDIRYRPHTPMVLLVIPGNTRPSYDSFTAPKHSRVCPQPHPSHKSSWTQVTASSSTPVWDGYPAYGDVSSLPLSHRLCFRRPKGWRRASPFSRNVAARCIGAGAVFRRLEDRRLKHQHTKHLTEKPEDFSSIFPINCTGHHSLLRRQVISQRFWYSSTGILISSAWMHDSSNTKTSVCDHLPTSKT